MQTITIAETGCYLDNHRGHYITRDAIELAVAYGFILDGFAQFAVDAYADDNHHDGYPHEALIELCDEAIAWLNSGQGECEGCGGDGKDHDHPHNAGCICRECSGTGRGPRIAGQNFPPIIPDGYMWGFNDGDFGLYSEEDEF